ncbi:MAG: phosphoribosyl-ATP diphosphatase [Halioglobus sp.]
MSDILSQLTATLEQRKSADAEVSYVAQLHKKGLNKILEKIGEESTEVVLAAKDAAASGNPDEFVAEVADLWFHCMVALSHLNSDTNDVLAVLEQRFNLSGLEEKASRNS